MGFDDKVKNAATDLQGKVKEAVGKVTGDSKQEAAGRADQAEADLKKASEHVKDAFKN